MLVIALPLGGCRASAFACNDATQCLAGGVEGTCQPDGWCSFPDPGCESGERYGDYAGEDVAGRCVPSGGSSSGVGGSDEHMTSIDSTVGESTLTTASTTASTSATTSADASDSDTNTTTSTTSTTTTTTDTGVPRSCGDGMLQPDEECDQGPSNDDHGECTKSCTIAKCGDGYIQGDEVCDAPEVGAVDCSYWGFSNGELSCAQDCQGVDNSTCEGCTDENCIPFGACDEMHACASGDNCVSVGSMIGTCLPPCDILCPMGSFCTISFDTCALACSDDADCPDNMHCTMLPSDDQGACMW